MSPPSGRKRVRMPVASEPAFSSVMQSAARPPSAMRGRMRRLRSSLPKSITGLTAWKVVDHTMPVAAQARAISCAARI